jgi:hypothetical protein
MRREPSWKQACQLLIKSTVRPRGHQVRDGQTRALSPARCCARSPAESGLAWGCTAVTLPAFSRVRLGSLRFSPVHFRHGPGSSTSRGIRRTRAYYGEMTTCCGDTAISALPRLGSRVRIPSPAPNFPNVKRRPKARGARGLAPGAGERCGQPNQALVAGDGGPSGTRAFRTRRETTQSPTAIGRHSKMPSLAAVRRSRSCIASARLSGPGGNALRRTFRSRRVSRPARSLRQMLRTVRRAMSLSTREFPDERSPACAGFPSGTAVALTRIGGVGPALTSLCRIPFQILNARGRQDAERFAYRQGIR